MLNHDNKCECGMCGGGFVIARWILGILILAIVFALGMKIGELKGQLESTRGGSMMSRGGGMQDNYNQGGYGMMGGGY